MDSALIPATYDVVWTIVSLLLLAGIVLAIAMLVRRSRRRDDEIVALRSEVEALKESGSLKSD